MSRRNDRLYQAQPHGPRHRLEDTPVVQKVEAQIKVAVWREDVPESPLRFPTLGGTRIHDAQSQVVDPQVKER